MKQVFLLLLMAGMLASCASMRTSSGHSNNENWSKPLLGEWRLFEDRSPDSLQYRSFVFNDDGTFISEVVRGVRRNYYNSGSYWMINDSTLVTVHDDGNKNYSNAGNVYTVNVDSDGFRLRGFFRYPISRAGMASASWIDERWGR